MDVYFAVHLISQNRQFYFSSKVKMRHEHSYEWLLSKLKIILMWNSSTSVVHSALSVEVFLCCLWGLAMMTHVMLKISTCEHVCLPITYCLKILCFNTFFSFIRCRVWGFGNPSLCWHFDVVWKLLQLVLKQRLNRKMHWFLCG